MTYIIVRRKVMKDLYDFSAEDIKDILVKECLKDEKAKELFESIMHDLMVQARAGVKESFLTFEDTPFLQFSLLFLYPV